MGDGARTLTAIVPSLRVDVLGARAFKVSRAYFAKGVAAGNVLIGGAKADQSASVEEGQKEFRKCGACHSTEQGGPNKVGPNLWNVVGAENVAH